MRYHCFHEIPDLPLDAFKHVGDRKIRPQGGGGGIPIVSDVVNVVSDIGQGAIDTVNDAAKAVETQVVAPVVKAVENTAAAIEQDPLGSAAKIATAIYAPAYLPAVVAADAVAKGEPLDKALEQAAKTYVAQQVGQGISNTVNSYVDSAGAASTYGTDVGSQQSNMLAAQESGLGTAGDISGNVAGTVAGGTAAGVIRGQDPLTALQNSGISAGTAAITSQIPGFSDLSPSAQKAVNMTVATTLQGGDASQALVNAAINAGIAEARNQANAPTSNLPGGTQVASTDGALPTVDVNQMSSPVYADSKTIGDVKAPVGFELMPAALNEKDANGNWLRPEGSYYDMYQNAWFMPSAEDTQSIKDLQAQLQNQPMPEVTTIPDVTTTDTGALPSTLIVDTSVQPSTGGLPATTTEQTVDQMPEIVITDKKDPYTGDIQLDLSGQPTSTVATPTAMPTSTAGVSTTAAPTVLGNFPATGSNVGQTTSATPSLGALPSAPTPTMLAAAPLEKQNMVLGELTQLYPQLANVDPRLLQILSGKSKSSSYYNYGQSGGTTPLMNAGSATMPTAGMPFKTSSTSGSSNLAGLTSSSGSGALSRAGLSMLDSNQTISGFAKGGLAEHNPEFITGATGHHVKGAGDGQSDSIPAMLADGEYVFDADTVAALGNGSNDAGARILDKMRQNIRKHKRSAPAGKIPPKAKSPLEYMKG